MSEGTTAYCGDNCNHTGEHAYQRWWDSYRGNAAKPGAMAAASVAVGEKRERRRIAEAVRRLVTDSDLEVYCEGWIDALDEVLAIIEGTTDE